MNEGKIPGYEAGKKQVKELLENWPKNLDDFANQCKKESGGISTLSIKEQNYIYKQIIGLKKETPPEIWENILLYALSYTPEAIRLRLELSIDWHESYPAELLSRIEEGGKRPVRLFRSAGSDILGLDNPLINEDFDWENETVQFIKKWDGNKKALLEFGQKIASQLGYSKDMIKMLTPQDISTYILTYHFEAAGPDNTHPHSCGAHGSNTKRAILQLFPTLATLAWAYGDTDSNFMVKIRRTRKNDSKAALFTIPNSFEEFKKMHFLPGTPQNQMHEEYLIGGHDQAPSSKIPLEELYKNMVLMNSLYPRADEDTSEDSPDKIAVLGCVDDRVKNSILGKQIQPSQLEEHVSDAFYLTIGRKARGLMDYRLGPPLCYRGSILPGVEHIDSNLADILKSHLFYQVPLILEHVMSNSFDKKFVYIDTVISSDKGKAKEERDTFRSILFELREKLAASDKDISIKWRVLEETSRVLEKGELEIAH